MQLTYRPKKALGQNFLRKVPKQFLINFNELARRVLITSGSSLNIWVIEIGPGLGAVTRVILDRLNSALQEHDSTRLSITLHLIEKDTRFISALTGLAKEYVNEGLSIHIVNQDVLKVKLINLVPQIPDFLFIYGSLPYNVSKKIVAWSIRQSAILSCNYGNLNFLPFRFLIQKEVAENYVSQEPYKEFLSVFLDFFVKDKKILSYVPAGAFYPVPKVDGAILSFNVDKDLLIRYKKSTHCLTMIRRFFNYKRKTMGKICKKDKTLTEVLPRIPSELLNKRPQELNTLQWRAIMQCE